MKGSMQKTVSKPAISSLADQLECHVLDKVV